MIIGGVAVGYYGYQRISGSSLYRPELKTDLDFWYKPTTENFVNLVSALEEMGVDTQDLKEAIFDPMKSFLKIPHKNFHTDFLPQMEGLKSFQESKKSSTRHLLDGNELHIISYHDLLQNKKAINRTIDQTDIEGLEKQNRD
jgi:hypothetical protein